MTYWELILPMTATGLILVCPLLSKAVYFCSSLPLPIFLFLLHIPLFIQFLYSLCPFLIHLWIFFNHILLSLPIFWFLTPVLWPLLSHMQVPPHSDFHGLCQTPSTQVLILAFLPTLLQAFFPSKLTLSQRNGAYRVLPALVAQSKLSRVTWLFLADVICKWIM